MNLTIVLVICTLVSTYGQTYTSGWLLQAAQLQRFLGYDTLPFNQIQLTSTHNSYSSDQYPSTHSVYELQANQRYGLSDQLNCLGVRGIEIDVHYISQLAAVEDDPTALRVCHSNPTTSTKVYSACLEIGWEVCESCGAQEYDPESAMCREDSPQLRVMLTEVYDWFIKPENAQEFLIIKLESFTKGKNSLISEEIEDIFGLEVVYSVQDFEDDGNVWPIVGELVQRGKRIVFFSPTETSDLVIAATENNKKPTTLEDTCPTINEETFQRVQGGEDIITFALDGKDIYTLENSPGDLLTEEDVPFVMDCGFIPTFDRMRQTHLMSTIWTWDEEFSANFSQPNMCAVIDVELSGKWKIDDCLNVNVTHYSCANSTDRSDWTLTNETDLNGAPICEDEFQYSVPITLNENNMLKSVMNETDIQQAYIYASSDEFGCWSFNGGVSYCIANGYADLIPTDETCGNTPEIVPTELINTCQNIPDPWPQSSYYASSYKPTKLTEYIHNWPRIRGGNEWSIENEYLTNSAISAIPLFVFGLLLGLIVIPLTACIKSRHFDQINDDGIIDFSSENARQNQKGYRIILVGFALSCFAIIVAAALSLAGTKGVDDNITTVTSEVNKAVLIMRTANEAAETLYGIITFAEEDLIEMVSCQLPSEVGTLLESIQADIDSAKQNIQDFLDRDLGGIANQIQDRSDFIENSKHFRDAFRSISIIIISIFTISFALIIGISVVSMRSGSIDQTIKRVKSGLKFYKIFLIPLAIIFVLLSLLIGGLITVASIIAADLCINPRENILKIFNNELLNETVKYYLTCDGVNIVADFLKEGYFLVLVAKGALSLILDDVWALACPNQVEAKEELGSFLAMIKNQTEIIGAQVQCSYINPIYETTIEGSVCTEGTESLFISLSGFVLMGISLAGMTITFSMIMKRILGKATRIQSAREYKQQPQIPF